MRKCNARAGVPFARKVYEFRLLSHFHGAKGFLSFLVGDGQVFYFDREGENAPSHLESCDLSSPSSALGRNLYQSPLPHRRLEWNKNLGG